MQLTRKILALNLFYLLAAAMLSGCGGGSASGNFGDDEEEFNDYSNSPLQVSPSSANQLVFTWERNDSADFYRFFANTGNGFVQIGDDIPVYTLEEIAEIIEAEELASDALILRVLEYALSVHTFDWKNTLFLLQSCTYIYDDFDEVDGYTCVDVGYQSARFMSPGAVGAKFAPSELDIGLAESYGISVDLSKDGLMLVVGASTNSVMPCPKGDEVELELDEDGIPDEDEIPDAFCEIEIQLVDPDDPENTETVPVGVAYRDVFFQGGSVFVYEREAITDSFGFDPVVLFAPNRSDGDNFGWAVSVSEVVGDRRLLAVSAIGEDGDADSAILVEGNDTVDSGNDDADGAGAVYIFEQDLSAGINAGWDHYNPKYVKAQNAGVGDQFGWALKLSDNGEFLAVSAPQEDSNSKDDPVDNSSNCAGAVYVFEADGGDWVQEAYLKATSPQQHDVFGNSLSLNADADGGASVLAVGMSQFPRPNYQQGCYNNKTPKIENEIDSKKPGEVHILERSGSAWAHAQRLTANVRDNGDSFGFAVSLNGEASKLAVGAPLDSSAATGIDGNAGNNQLFPAAGAAYLFVTGDSGWSQKHYIKASNTGATDYFGFSLSLNAAGNLLAIGAIGEAGNDFGINGSEDFDSAPGSGAVYLFSENQQGWRQKAYIKSPLLQVDGYFGWALDFAEDDARLVITSPTVSGGAVLIY